MLDFGVADPLHDQPLRVLFAGRDLSMSYNRTPLAGWSDGRRVHGLFTDAEDAACSDDADCGSGSCLKGELGRCGVEPCPPRGDCPRDPGFDSVLAPPVCRVGSDECAVVYSPRRRCLPEPEGRGLCVDPTNSLWLTQSAAQPQQPDRRLLATHWVYVAAEDPARPSVFEATTRFATAKFLNPAALTVAAFDPDDPSRNDYRDGRDTLLVWGRPWWSATGGARSLVYLLYNRLAPTTPGGAMPWAPRYFAGYREDGRPRWSDREADAAPLYPSEFDIVNQLSVSWVEPLRAWVMLYGGDQLVTGGVPEPRTYEAPEPGAVHLRWAAHPWGAASGGAGRGRGAWSDPYPALRPRDVPQLLACRAKDEPPGCVAGDKVRPIDFFRARLTGADCRAGSGGFDRGFFYSAGVIDVLTRSVTPARSGARAAEIVWLVSTWNPYAVELFKSRIEIPPE